MTGTFGYGQMDYSDIGSEADALQFVLKQYLARVRTAMPVKVIAVHGGGGSAPPPTVDVQPLVNQLDGNSNAVPHGTIFGLPVLRLQAGTAAIVADPIAGDIGLIVCADRDITNVVANKAAANPGSYRRHDLADGVYLGSIIGAAPTASIAFTASGIAIKDANGNTITLAASGFTVQDAAGNKIVSTSAGLTLTDSNAHQIVMSSTGVNVIAPVLQVNGTALTVP